MHVCILTAKKHETRKLGKKETLNKNGGEEMLTAHIREEVQKNSNNNCLLCVYICIACVLTSKYVCVCVMRGFVMYRGKL
jgi:hypothetical protein